MIIWPQEFDIQFPDGIRKCVVKLHISIITGDALSGLTLCSQKMGKTMRMSRQCFVSFHECDDPFHVCKWVKASQIEAISEEYRNVSGLTKERAKFLKNSLDVLSVRKYKSSFANFTQKDVFEYYDKNSILCLLYTSPSPRDS